MLLKLEKAKILMMQQFFLLSCRALEIITLYDIWINILPFLYSWFPNLDTDLNRTHSLNYLNEILGQRHDIFNLKGTLPATTCLLHRLMIVNN